ncbi:MAG: caspase family protein [Deltaproteobacteria bacterium]|nr:caspase family protein [Deltaproteobacteria bacterium]
MPFNAVANSAKQNNTERIVIIVGNNHSLDSSIADLHYADDDALLYYQLFIPYADGTYLLSLLDDSSQARYSEYLNKALPPTRANLIAALADAFAQINTSHQKSNVQSELIIIFVGHGVLDNAGKGFLHLQDSYFTRDDIFKEIISVSPASNTHIIVDACHALSMVAGRGESSTHVSLTAFSRFLSGNELENYPNVGVLTASTNEQNTHEWSRIESGVFSFLVRSGLLGPADINNDSFIEYSEIAAFVASASSRLMQVGKEINVFAWPPARNRRIPILNFKHGNNIRLVQLGPKISERLFLEAANGAIWAGLHPAGESPLTLALPQKITFFLRGVIAEQVIPSGKDVLKVNELSMPLAQLHKRGATEQAFEQNLLSTPFSQGYYSGYVSQRPGLIAVELSQKPALIAANTTNNSSNVSMLKNAISQSSNDFWQTRSGYMLSRSPLVYSRLVHGALFELTQPITPSLRFSYNLEFGIVPQDGRKSQLFNSALTIGLNYETASIGPLYALMSVSGGWGLWLVNGKTSSSADYTVWLGRLCLGAGVHLSPKTSLELIAGTAVYFVTVDSKEKTRWAPQATLAFSWKL